MFTYKELLNIESALVHLIKETKPHDQSEQMRVWRDELGELLVKVQAAQDGWLDNTSQAD
jgi:hypothetical protein